MTLVDSHCHLDYLQRDGDLEPVIERAEAAGVSHLVTICTKLSEFNEVRAIAERFPQVTCSVGVHPHETDGEGVSDPETLLALCDDPKVVAIGETGLDFYYEHSKRDRQERSFRTHIAAARSSGLPVIVHTRDADQETIDILREEQSVGRFSGLIHCFSTSTALAEAAVDLGLYISVAGIVTFKKAEALRDAVQAVPLDRLLVETDAPYLSPVPFRGKRNEPAHVVHTAAALAKLKAITPEAMAEATTRNFFTLFAKAAQSHVSESGEAKP